MRFPGIVAVALILTVAPPASAQEWTTYTNRLDRFEVNFPGQPKVDEIKWPSEYGAVFPGRVYSLEQNGSRYSVTVIDYTDAERIHAARTNHTEADSLPIYWQVDVQASIAYAATKFRQRPGVNVTYDAFHYIDLVSGHQLQITNPDQSRTFAGIYLHESRLYILEATVAGDKLSLKAWPEGDSEPSEPMLVVKDKRLSASDGTGLAAIAFFDPVPLMAAGFEAVTVNATVDNITFCPGREN